MFLSHIPLPFPLTHLSSLIILLIRFFSVVLFQLVQCFSWQKVDTRMGITFRTVVSHFWRYELLYSSLIFIYHFGLTTFLPLIKTSIKLTKYLNIYLYKSRKIQSLVTVLVFINVALHIWLPCQFSAARNDKVAMINML